jgi:hypothetical protein
MFWFSSQPIVPDMKTILEIDLKQNNGCYLVIGMRNGFKYMRSSFRELIGFRQEKLLINSLVKELVN